MQQGTPDPIPRVNEDLLQAFKQNAPIPNDVSDESIGT